MRTPEEIYVDENKNEMIEYVKKTPIDELEFDLVRKTAYLCKVVPDVDYLEEFLVDELHCIECSYELLDIYKDGLNKFVGEYEVATGMNEDEKKELLDTLKDELVSIIGDFIPKVYEDMFKYGMDVNAETNLVEGYFSAWEDNVYIRSFYSKDHKKFLYNCLYNVDVEEINEAFHKHTDEDPDLDLIHKIHTLETQRGYFFETYLEADTLYDVLKDCLDTTFRYVVGIDGSSTPDPGYWHDRMEIIEASNEQEAINEYLEMKKRWLRDEEKKLVKVHYRTVNKWLCPVDWANKNLGGNSNANDNSK